MARNLVVAVLAVSWLSGCPNDAGYMGFGSGPVQGDDPYYCCDPDQTPCLCEGFWHCTEGALGKTCRQTNPGLPDGGGMGPWACEYEGQTIVCSGRQDEHPEAGTGQNGDWICTDLGEMIECNRTADEGDYPTGEGDGPWDCSFSPGGGLRACTDSSGSGDTDWECSVSWDGSTVCVNSSADQPDAGNWSCTQSAGRDVCESDHFPSGGGGSGWNCTQNGEVVQCENDVAQEPDFGGDAPWSCFWGEGSSELTCIQVGNIGGGDDVGNGGRGDGGGGGGNGNEGGGGDGDGGGGSGEDDDGGGQDCSCPPDAWRYCDTPMYCSWGIQECQETDGKSRWGLCREDQRIPDACWNGEMFDAEAEQCALDEGFCVQDFWDLDRDGDSNETLGENCPEVGQCIGGDDDWGGWF